MAKSSFLGGEATSLKQPGFRIHLWVVLAILVASPWKGSSQTQPPELPVTASFEVASVKRHHSIPAPSWGFAR